MAIDYSASAERWHYLVEIDLDAETLRYAEVNLSMDDHTFYEGRLRGLPPIELALGSLLDPRFIQPQIRLVLDDADGALQTLIDDNQQFARKVVRLKIGQGTDPSDYDTRFTGVVLFPNGIEWDDLTVSLLLDSTVPTDSRVLPVDLIDPDTYPNMEQKSEYAPIPNIYGDWRSTAGGGETVPAYQIDSTVGTGGLFLIAAVGDLQAIEAVYKDGVSVSFTADVPNSQFTLNIAYDPTSEEITANVLGRAGDGGSYKLHALCIDLLENLLGIPSARLNAAAFADWDANSSSNTIGRRWIGAPIQGLDLIIELAEEGFVDMLLDADGEYHPAFRIAGASPTPTVIREVDIVPRSDGGRNFTVHVDPERLYLNEIVVDYVFKPDEEYAKTFEQEDAPAIAAIGLRRRRRLQMKWLYDDEPAQQRGIRELYAFSTIPEMVEMILGPRGLQFEPTDQFELIYRKYEVSGITGTPFMVRQVKPDFARGQARVFAWNLNLLTPGRWTDDAAPDWSGSSEYEKTTNGFWTDAAGLADPPDLDSAGSIWF